MAPHATDLFPVSPDLVAVNKHSKCVADLEAISDAVDQVNQLRGAIPGPPKPLYDTPIDAPPGFTPSRDADTFRQYQQACERVKLFYAEQHAKQTVAYGLAARARFHSAARVRPEMTIWQAIEMLDTLVDDSDPDTELSQSQHLLQSAEAIRKDGKPRWMQLTGLLHDLGKLMYLLPGCCSGQWDVVGDTFPVGCQFDELCIFHDEFGANPDSKNEAYSSKYGVYEPGCGMDRLMMSWGHDEYLYLVLRDQSTLPKEALAMIRYHSFYSWHKEGAYREFMAEGDEELLRAVKAFNPYDLYSKGDEVPNVDELKVSFFAFPRLFG
jgi:inositol oxygenase